MASSIIGLTVFSRFHCSPPLEWHRPLSGEEMSMNHLVKRSRFSSKRVRLCSRFLYDPAQSCGSKAPSNFSRLGLALSFAINLRSCVLFHSFQFVPIRKRIQVSHQNPKQLFDGIVTMGRYLPDSPERMLAEAVPPSILWIGPKGIDYEDLLKAPDLGFSFKSPIVRTFPLHF